MDRSGFEYEVLERCGNDYEAPHTIAGDLARDLGRIVTESEVLAAFLSLESKGLVQAYVFEAGLGDFVPLSSEAAPEVDALWFMMNAKGRASYENEAS